MECLTRFLLWVSSATLAGAVLSACGQRHTPREQCRMAELPAAAPPPQRLVIGVAQQKMVTFDWHVPRKMYRVSTSKFGLGNQPGSWRTPLGQLEVVKVVGRGLPMGMRLRGREPTGEMVPINAPEHDSIVTRVLVLDGKEPGNAHTQQRAIYIHGTSAENKLESPASWGCVRMASADIIELCQWIRPGARVDIVTGKIPPPDQLPR